MGLFPDHEVFSAIDVQIIAILLSPSDGWINLDRPTQALTQLRQSHNQIPQRRWLFFSLSALSENANADS